MVDCPCLDQLSTPFVQFKLWLCSQQCSGAVERKTRYSIVMHRKPDTDTLCLETYPVCELLQGQVQSLFSVNNILIDSPGFVGSLSRMSCIT